MKILLATALLIAAPAFASTESRNVAAGEAQLQDLLKGAIPGKPSTCLPILRPTDSRNIQGIGILYRQGHQSYLMRFQDGCPMLGRDDILVTRSFTRMCRGDIAEVRMDSPPAATRGTCVVGDFTPYKMPPRAH